MSTVLVASVTGRRDDLGNWTGVPFRRRPTPRHDKCAESSLREEIRRSTQPYEVARDASARVNTSTRERFLSRGDRLDRVGLGQLRSYVSPTHASQLSSRNVGLFGIPTTIAPTGAAPGVDRG